MVGALMYITCQNHAIGRSGAGRPFLDAGGPSMRSIRSKTHCSSSGNRAFVDLSYSNTTPKTLLERDTVLSDQSLRL